MIGAQMNKPCPFCGSIDIMTSSDVIQKMGGWLIEAQTYCYMCGAKGPSKSRFFAIQTSQYVTLSKEVKVIERNAKEAWNLRIKKD